MLSITFVTKSYASEIINMKNNNFCIPKEHFGIKDLRPWDKKEKLISTLGKPKKITQSTDVDDGGEYKVFTYHYEYIRIDIARNLIDKIVITSNKYSMSSNIKTGITKKQLSNILNVNLEKKTLTNNSFGVVRCTEKDIWYMDYVTFKFNETDILREIRFEANRP